MKFEKDITVAFHTFTAAIFQKFIQCPVVMIDEKSENMYLFIRQLTGNFHSRHSFTFRMIHAGRQKFIQTADSIVICQRNSGKIQIQC